MTEQEIEKLREKLGGDYSVKRLNGAITVELVDIWKGVEFAEVTAKSNGFVTEGKIYRIYDPSISSMIIVNDKVESGGIVCKSSAKPSTEAEYVEQLKAKANELYGYIKDGDRFEFTWIGDGDIRNIRLLDNYDFYYDKESDTLDLHGFPLYKQGKWAKKVERVNVEVANLSSSRQAYSLCRFYNIQFKTNDISTPYNLSDISAHLAKCLEDYLNKS